MKKLYIFMLVFCGSASVFGTSFATSQCSCDQSSITATQIINFKPSSAQGNPIAGHCFASSIALERPDAWRCQVDNSIYDPCFTTSAKNKLICGANPAINKRGFPLQLTKKLPPINNASTVTAKPWILMLADGSICTSYTGSMPLIPEADKMIGLQYGCLGSASAKKQQSGIVESSLDMSNKVWRAKQMIYTVKKDGSPQVVKTIPVNIKTAWQ